MENEMNTNTTRNCFVILPEELWELIFDLLSDNNDVRNVLAASPELGNVFQERKPRWLIDQVFPLMYHYYNEDAKSVLSCRPVSKRWCQAIDNFLSDHPSRLPYSLNGVSRRTVPYQEFAYEDVKQFPTLEMCSPERILSVLEEMRDHPRNPFLTRVVKLYPLKFKAHASNKYKYPPEEYVDACIAFFEKLGHHIWDLTWNLGSIEYDDEDEDEEEPSSKRIRDKIVHGFSLLPNLRSLEFGIIEDDEGMCTEELERDLCFPVLPHLKTLKITTGSTNEDTLLNSLFRSYGLKPQIKKLEVPLFPYFNDEIINQYENLSEIYVILCSDYCWERIQHVLKTGVFSSLKKIQLMAHTHSGEPLNLFPFFKILSRLEIEELEMYDGGNSLKAIWTPILDEIVVLPSLKYLRIQDGPLLDFEFLNSLPNLEHLQVIGDFGQVGKHFISTRTAERTVSYQLRSYLYMLSVPENISIWNLLPQLKVLTVVRRQGVFRRRFLRECANKCFELNNSHELHKIWHSIHARRNQQ